VGKAVTRNLVRRRLREILRALPIEAGYDLVITGFAASAEASFEELRRETASVLGRCGILGGDRGAS
jgi:ribonuclease P protein component